MKATVRGARHEPAGSHRRPDRRPEARLRRSHLGRAHEGTRESISDWAATLRRAEEAELLSFDPPRARDRLWEAITYLEGVDLKDGPSTYLHVVEDFRIFRDAIGL